jgi:uncharacterized damage-inducible protein DinB
MEQQILDTWNIRNRITLYVLDSIAPEALSSTSSSKGRSVGAMFAHIHNSRLMWLEVAGKEYMEGLSKLEKQDQQSKEQLHSALEASGKAIELLIQKGIEAGGKIKGFKPHATAFLGYMISHDAYHIGEIGMALKQAGHPLDDKISYGMWEWGSR